MFNFKKKVICLSTAVSLAASMVMVPTGTPVYAKDEPVEMKEVNLDDWTIGLYVCGANLESENANASSDIVEILEADVPKDFSENVNIIIQTGGCAEWQFKDTYSEVLSEKGYSESEIDKIIPEEIDANKIQEYKVNFNHVIVNDEGEKVSVPTLEFIRDVAEYSELNDAEMDDYVSMGDSKYLESFLKDMNTEFPAKHRMIDFWNHGGGIAGGVCYDENTDDDCLTLRELLAAFDNTKSEELGKFDIVGYDACLMSNYETWNRLSAYAETGVGSLTSEPGAGWYYTPFIEELGDNYSSDEYTGRELSKAIVKAYKDYYNEGGVLEELAEEMGVSDSLDSSLGEAVLCSVDLEELNKSVPVFNELSADLIKLYADKEGNEYIRQQMKNAKIDDEFNISSIDKFLDIIAENADSRKEAVENDFHGFAEYASDLYEKEKTEAVLLKELIGNSIIDSYNGHAGNKYENMGSMSIFFPDSAKPEEETAFFTLEDYPEYALNSNYALYTYYMAYENEFITREEFEAAMSIDVENDEFITVIPVGSADSAAVSNNKIIEKDGRYYFAMNLDNTVSMNDETYTVKHEMVDYHFECDGMPLLVGGDEDAYNVEAYYNGRPGLLSFKWDDELNKYVVAMFIDSQTFDFTFVFNEGDEFKFENSAFDELDVNVDSEEEGETVSKSVKIKKENLIYEDGELLACEVPFDMIVDNNINASYLAMCIHDARLVAFGIIPLDEAVIDTCLVEYDKYKSFVKSNISVASKEYELTGYAIEPEILFDGKKGELVKGVDYEVTYENNIGIGKAKAIIKGIGQYAMAPERIVEFNIIKTKNADGKVVYKTVIVKTPKRANIKTVKNIKKKSLSVKWKKVKGASGYEVRYALNKKFTKGNKVKNIKNGKKVSLKIKKLKKKTYFVKVRAYTLDPDGNKIYGDYSRVKKVKVRR